MASKGKILLSKLLHCLDLKNEKKLEAERDETEERFYEQHFVQNKEH